MRLCTPTAEEERPQIIRLSTIRPQPVVWLWTGRLALGKPTILDGDPDRGKSSLALDIAARLTRGEAMPDDEHNPPQSGGVVLLSAEDGMNDMLRPRLDAAGAVVERIASLPSIQRGHESRPVELPLDCDYLAETIEEVEAKLVIIDPLIAYLGSRYSANNDQDVRRALH